MTDRSNDVDRRIKRAKATTRKVADEARGAGESGIDEMREVARQAFEKIKAARERTAKLVD